MFASDDAHGCAWTCTPCNPLNFQGGSLAKVSQTAGAADTREPGTLAPGRPLAPSAYPRRPRLRGGGGGVRVPRGGGGMGPRPRPAARPAAVGFRVGGGGQGWPRLLPPPSPWLATGHPGIGIRRCRSCAATGVPPAAIPAHGSRRVREPVAPRPPRQSLCPRKYRWTWKDQPARALIPSGQCLPPDLHITPKSEAKTIQPHPSPPVAVFCG